MWLMTTLRTWYENKIFLLYFRFNFLIKKKIVSTNQIQDIRDKHRNNLLHISCALGRLNSVKILAKNFPKMAQQSNDKQQRPIDVAIKVSNS